MNNHCKHIFAAFLFLFPISAFAYIGPGSGLSAIGTIVALIGAILMMFVGFMWYPLKRLLKKKNAADEVDCEVVVENDLRSEALTDEKPESTNKQ